MDEVNFIKILYNHIANLLIASDMFLGIKCDEYNSVPKNMIAESCSYAALQVIALLIEKSAILDRELPEDLGFEVSHPINNKNLIPQYRNIRNSIIHCHTTFNNNSIVFRDKNSNSTDFYILLTHKNYHDLLPKLIKSILALNKSNQVN